MVISQSVKHYYERAKIMKPDGCLVGNQPMSMSPEKIKDNSENSSHIECKKINELSPKERKKMMDEFLDAMPMVARWFTAYIRDTKYPEAFSPSYLGEEDPLTYFTGKVTNTFMKGTWKKYENEKMTTFLIRILKSILKHHLRKWKESKPNVKAIGQMSEKQRFFAEPRGFPEEQEDTDALRNISFRFAEAAVEGDRELKKFLKAVKEKNTYRDISKRMKKNMYEVKELEKRLLKKVTSCVRFVESNGEPDVKKYLKAMKEDSDESDMTDRLNMSNAELEKVKDKMIELVRFYGSIKKEI